MFGKLIFFLCQPNNKKKTYYLTIFAQTVHFIFFRFNHCQGIGYLKDLIEQEMVYQIVSKKQNSEKIQFTKNSVFQTLLYCMLWKAGTPWLALSGHGCRTGPYNVVMTHRLNIFYIPLMNLSFIQSRVPNNGNRAKINKNKAVPEQLLAKKPSKTGTFQPKKHRSEWYFYICSVSSEFD